MITTLPSEVPAKIPNSGDQHIDHIFRVEPREFCVQVVPSELVITKLPPKDTAAKSPNLEDQHTLFQFILPIVVVNDQFIPSELFVSAPVPQTATKIFNSGDQQTLL